MKRIFSLFFIVFTAINLFAVTVDEVSGSYKGMLNIGGQPYPDKEVFILPGVEAGTITFVLPDFSYNGASLGNIVLVNMAMDAGGQLTLDDATLYIRAIAERATVSVINGLEEGGQVYNSVVSADAAQVLLSIAAPSLPEPIFVLFAGEREASANYELTNGGFEGSWSNNEAPSWHSFPSATGNYSSYVTGNTEQFQQSSEVRPGSTGSQSAMMRSNLTLGVKANGNCTNGRINAGSLVADDAAGNYNFSDPSNSGYNTAFVGNPDSIVFWSKYIPADENPSNSANKARMHTVITTDARYQDPESADYSAVKIAEAEINYAATSDMGWQRLSVPFTYSSVDPTGAAYVLVTFTSNMTPGGGSTYSTGSIFNKKYYYDYVYLDDVEMVYNHSLSSATLNGSELSFANGTAVSELEYSDSAYDFALTTDAKAAKNFIGYDALHNRAYIYIVADNYSQAQAYSVYTVQMVEPVPPVIDNEYSYEAFTCANEPYSDSLFTNLTESGIYVDTLVNITGGDSVVTLTLTVWPVYEAVDSISIYTNDSLEWQGRIYSGLEAGFYQDTVELFTYEGCDSTVVLYLTVVEAEPVGTAVSAQQAAKRYAQKVLQNEQLYIILDDKTKYSVLGIKIQ